jgi:FtsP/CotA-like multicopper oxidase with cupredoxin domain
MLHVGLEMRMARWHPDGEDGTGLLIPVFAEAGKAPQVPAPLLRMPAGTDVVVTLRNSLDVSASVHGLHARPADAALPVRLEAGETREAAVQRGGGRNVPLLRDRRPSGEEDDRRMPPAAGTMTAP